ncbi:hypothetical protein GIB67_030996 [Kingdonia uniflora]|uniref:Hexosyltransferase n=1 Tax=Kingdonia uniflora TaxID=39325 RepID=A0A7J7LSM7_9MAGN|nr:hypothetical protein GIB67_030996 [Kingdonia uniflora]
MFFFTIIISDSIVPYSEIINNGGDLITDTSRFSEAPEYRNGPECSVSYLNTTSSCEPSHVHIAMTLDKHYLRGSMAAILSVLKHASCPENVFFHFIATTNSVDSMPSQLSELVRSTFPSLYFKLYLFNSHLLKNRISSSIREALENPLNYARNYLGDILEICVDRVIYLDSDLLVVDDIAKLWRVSLSKNRIIGAPEYCKANFTGYFTNRFWSDPNLARVFLTRKPCYFNTGVMVMDLKGFRERKCRERIERWMEVQKEKRIYELGSLPPFLLEFGGNVEPIEHRGTSMG